MLDLERGERRINIRGEGEQERRSDRSSDVAPPTSPPASSALGRKPGLISEGRETSPKVFGSLLGESEIPKIPDETAQC